MSEPNENSIIRLNKYLALQLGISRREADLLISQGKVSINGSVAVLGARINHDDKVLVRDKPVKDTVKTEYFAFHKPVGYVSSRKSQGENPTIYTLLPQKLHALKPVGRLDRDSSGILLLTNDGDFAYRMTHPKFHKTKVYHVRLDHTLEPLHQQMISDHGVSLEDGTSKFVVTRLDEPKDTYEITMSEGRNRQIRRTFSALGYTVTQLHRIRFGRFSIDGLKEGEFAPIDVTSDD